MEALLQGPFEMLTALFSFLLTVIGAILAMQFRGLRQDVQDLAKNQKELSNEIKNVNLTLVEVVTDQSWQKTEIADIKKRIEKLETRSICHGSSSNHSHGITISN